VKHFQGKNNAVLGKEEARRMSHLHFNKLSKKEECSTSQHLYYSFFDYEKAYDNLNREKLWQILKEEDIQPQLIRAMQSLYQN
jgi:hypothetical protein